MDMGGRGLQPRPYLLHVDPLHLSFILVSHWTTWARREGQELTSHKQEDRFTPRSDELSGTSWNPCHNLSESTAQWLQASAVRTKSQTRPFRVAM